MGASASADTERNSSTEGEENQEVFDLKKIPNDQYTCPECASVPEISHLYLETNEIEIKCKEHGKRRMFLKEYFKNEMHFLYSKSICNVCLKCQETQPEYFQFCYDCRRIFCAQCVLKHNHKSLVTVNEVNNRCSRHFEKKSKFYCKKCDVNICHEDDDPKHKLKVIADKKPDPKDMEKIKKKNDYFRKEKKLLDCLIKITDTVLTTYKKYPHNYMHSLNVTKIAESIIGRKEENEEKKLNQINIEYKIKNPSSNSKIRIFGAEFVKNNKKKLTMYLNNSNAETEVTEFYPLSIKGDRFTIRLAEKESLTNMSFMFDGCDCLTDVTDLAQWDMYDVKNLSHLFNGCSSLESLPDISRWDISAVTDISYMFAGCTNLTSLPDISEWKTCSVTYMSNLFQGCVSLNYLPDISRWDTSYVTYISSMFEGCSGLKMIPDLSRWKVSNVIDMNSLFKECTNLPSVPNFSKWETANCTNMHSMFHNCSKLSKLPNISKWNTSKVTDISHMFDGCTKVTAIPDISSWITCSLENMAGLFNKCSSLPEIPDISNWITQKVKDMSCMFCNCSSLNYFPDLSKWNTDLVTDMNHMFDGCKLVEEMPDISTWNTSNVTNMGCMFYYCEQLISIPDLSHWDTSKVTYMIGMFDGCSALDKKLIPVKFT